MAADGGGRHGERHAPPWLAIAALCAVPLCAHLAIVVLHRSRFSSAPQLGMALKLGVVSAAALAHWAIYAVLLATFALTLRPGRTPLITTLARRMHGRLTPEMAGYTRRVTLAWCGFFLLQLGLSIGLFFFAPIVVWSFFVNVLDLPLVALMFFAEYLVRLRVLADPPRQSFGETLRMVTDRKTLSAPP